MRAGSFFLLPRFINLRPLATDRLINFVERASQEILSLDLAARERFIKNLSHFNALNINLFRIIDLIHALNCTQTWDGMHEQIA
jgi:hypothetical protein